ncbi:NAD(P)-binding protein [Streptomyces violaceusniger]|uniref:NAD(P)-binding protein n=1 Tax=Streptomyces violaceusniger TaxID=68280 RepID=UPI0034146046
MCTPFTEGRAEAQWNTNAPLVGRRGTLIGTAAGLVAGSFTARPAAAARGRRTADLDVIVTVIGAGAAALSSARVLADAGKSVVVVEARDRSRPRGATRPVRRRGRPYGYPRRRGAPPLGAIACGGGSRG